MGFLFGIPRKLLKRVTEIEIDTHYYDTDVIPSSQDIFTFDVDTKTKTATITGFTENAKNITNAVMPYRVKYGNDTSELWANVTSIKNGAFKDCSYLQSMTIPNTIEIIPKNCFLNCTSLYKVNIPKSINSIITGAFNNCTSLETLFIPYEVKTIENSVFTNCNNLKFLCYKYSTAETYAVDNDIKYSLISYTLDEDITENSANLVTSGIIYKHIKDVIKKINTHINNKINPHDNSTFTNAVIKNSEGVNITLTGDTSIDNTFITKGTLNELTTDTQTINDEEVEIVADNSLINKKYLDETINLNNDSIDEKLENLQDTLQSNIDKIVAPDIGSGYQKAYDTKLETDTKSVVGAINEINDKVNTISGELITGWNTISLNKLYPVNWRFTNTPYCYTHDGITVDYRIKDLSLIENNMNTFKIHVPIDCHYTLSTTSDNTISGTAIDYLILRYYYTGADGKDLDTVTELNNDWSISRKTIGYGHQPDVPIKNSNGITLIQFSGDNTGGGSENQTKKYYECVYFDVKHIQEEIPNEDVEILLYAGWYSSIGNGHINVSLSCYANETTPMIVDEGDTLKLTVNGEDLLPTYENNTTMECNVLSKITSGSAAKYDSTYTPTFKLIFHKTIEGSNHRTVTIQQLS